MSEPTSNRLTFLYVLIVALLGVSVWQQYQLKTLEERVLGQLAKQSTNLNKLRAVMTPFETLKPPQLLPIQSGKTRSELHGPRGPMPVSMLTKSDPLPGDPSPGTDVTSNIERPKKDPCEAMCRRLADCALEPEYCPEMDTRQHEKVYQLCMDACGAGEAVKTGLSGVTECAKGVSKARALITTFSSLCGELR